MRTSWFAAAALCTVALVSPMLVSPCFAQVNDDAKAVLTESAKAIKDAKGMTFSVKTYATGMLKDIIDLSGDVKVWRPEGASAGMWMVDGRAKNPGKPDRKLMVTSDGASVTWLSYDDNIKYTRPASDSQAMEMTNMCKELLLPDMLNPTFTEELGKPILAKTGVNNVGGEVCDVVEAMPAGKDRNRTWSISVKDRLPRQLELGTGNAAQKITKVSDISNVKVVALTAKDFNIALPNGFKEDKMAAAPVAPINNPAAPAPEVKLGLAAGAAAPAFGTGEMSLASMKGNVVVLEFWGTVFKQSTAHVAEMKTLAGTFKSNVKMLGVACRSDEKAATEWWTKSGPGYPLIAKGDAIAADYKVMGYPSYYVINGDGNVAAFFQEFPGADKLKAAIETAGGK